MLKSFNEMRKIDVSPFCKLRDGIPYLNWAKCIDLLHQNGVEKVSWEPIPDPVTGSSLRMSCIDFLDKNNVANRCYETRIRVTIDDNTYEIQTPVLNGMNPVKNNSMNQLRVWNSMCRAFVKCVAIHTGLGFDLWLGEENSQDLYIPSSLDKLASKAKIKTILSLCVSHGIDSDKWIKQTGKTWDTITEKEAALMLDAIKRRYGDE